MKKFIVLSLVSVSMLFSGCAAIVIGGAAATGYAVGKDDRSAKRIADDAGITAAVKTKFLADKYVKGLSIDVDTYVGEVTLTGTANSNFSIERAENIARATRGVIDVRNNLTVVE